MSFKQTPFHSNHDKTTVYLLHLCKFEHTYGPISPATAQIYKTVISNEVNLDLGSLIKDTYLTFKEPSFYICKIQIIKKLELLDPNINIQFVMGPIPVVSVQGVVCSPSLVQL